MFKRAFCIVLLVITVAAAIIPLTSFAGDRSGHPFTDVPKWADSSVQKMYDNGYMNGISETLFGSSKTLTRGMFALVVAKIAGAELGSSGVSSFEDVPTGAYYTAAVNWTFENGLMSGTSVGKFSPGDAVTREQAIVILRNLGDHLNYDVTYEDDTMLILYHDNDKISGYARKAVAWGVDYGLISGDTDFALNPRKAATRAEMAVILDKFLDYTITPPIVPPVIYTVRYANWNGDLLYTDHVAAGGHSRYRASTPVRDPDSEYVYFFKGWDKDVASTVINSNVTFIAEYRKEIRTVKATFVNWDGKTLYYQTVKYGEKASYSGSTPTRPTDNNYVYTFSGWDKGFSPLYSDTTYKAQYSKVNRTVKVTFVNWDGKTLLTTEIKYGTKAAYSGSTPTKNPDNNYVYTFSGWDKSFTPLYDDTTYKAQFTKKDRTVKATFVNWDGKTLQSTNVKYGAKAAYKGSTPTRPADNNYVYTFSGWDKSFAPLYDDTTYKAQFTKKSRTVKVTFVNWDGKKLLASTVKYGQKASYTGNVPTRPEDDYYTYEFSGWDKSFAPLYDDTKYTAQYKATKKRNIHDDKFSKDSIDMNGSGGYKISSGLLKSLNNVLYDRGERNVGLYVVDLESLMTIGYHANNKFWTACTVKAPMAMVAYKRAEQGYFSLDKTYWEYKKEHFVERSGVIQFKPFGTKYKAREVIHLMINISDNVAYYMCQDYVGYQYFNEEMERLGVANRHYSFKDWKYFTPQELGFIWQEIYRYRNTSSYGKYLYDEFLNGDPSINFIRRGLNSKYPVAHKSGWNEAYVFNDAGIVMSDRPYIIVILMTDKEYEGNSAYLGRIARAVDAIMTEYAAYMKNK